MAVESISPRNDNAPRTRVPTFPPSAFHRVARITGLRELKQKSRLFRPALKMVSCTFVWRSHHLHADCKSYQTLKSPFSSPYSLLRRSSYCVRGFVQFHHVQSCARGVQGGEHPLMRQRECRRGRRRERLRERLRERPRELLRERRVSVGVSVA